MSTRPPLSTTVAARLAASSSDDPTKEYIRLGRRIIAIEKPTPANLIGIPHFTDQNGTPIASMPAVFGTTAINVGWTTSVRPNCTYGGVAANGDGTTSHNVTRSPLTNGFSETQTITCTEVLNTANTASTTVSVSVQAAITITGLNYTNQSGTAISMPAAAGTTAINVGWTTNISANCTFPLQHDPSSIARIPEGWP